MLQQQQQRDMPPSQDRQQRAQQQNGHHAPDSTCDGSATHMHMSKGSSMTTHMHAICNAASAPSAMHHQHVGYRQCTAAQPWQLEQPSVLDVGNSSEVADDVGARIGAGSMPVSNLHAHRAEVQQQQQQPHIQRQQQQGHQSTAGASCRSSLTTAAAATASSQPQASSFKPTATEGFVSLSPKRQGAARAHSTPPMQLSYHPFQGWRLVATQALPAGRVLLTFDAGRCLEEGSWWAIVSAHKGAQRWRVVGEGWVGDGVWWPLRHCPLEGYC